MIDSDDHDFYEGPEEYDRIEPDDYFIGVQEGVKKIYEADRESVFYLRQLQVKFEKRYFHWITNNALEGLIKIDYLKDIRVDTGKGTSTRFFVHKTNRYSKRRINEIGKIIKEYSQDHITRSCGHRAEDLFCASLAMKGFMPIAKKVKEHKGKKWEETGHDLDYIFVIGDVEYGCEIKNTLGYIDKNELEIKLRMCSFFGVKPLFIVRYAPKTILKKYMKLVDMQCCLSAKYTI